MDLISDALTRIRNAAQARQTKVDLQHSKLVERIMVILQTEGYIRKFQVVEEGPARVVRVFLRFDPAYGYAIQDLRRISKPSKRVYCGRDEIPDVRSGLGISIISTSKGVMTGVSARTAGVGGEVLCTIF
jgi:small subunit ribosomal protein S8